MARRHQNLDAGGDEKLKINFMWPYAVAFFILVFKMSSFEGQHTVTSVESASCKRERKKPKSSGGENEIASARSA